MIDPSNPLPRPTSELVASYIQKYSEKQAVVDAALGNLFQAFPNNTAYEDVLLKVVALNGLYATNIFATNRMAQHIWRLNIDSQLQAGSTDVVERIAPLQIGDKVRNNYSFATKYCAWHAPDAYPIYDSRVETMLWGYRNQTQFTNFRRQDLRSYKSFRDVILAFRNYFQLTDFTLREIDKFLWLAGSEYYP